MEFRLLDVHVVGVFLPRLLEEILQDVGDL